jgi:hypothetical protein
MTESRGIFSNFGEKFRPPYDLYVQMASGAQCFVEMRARAGRHIGAETAEKYSMGKLPARKVPEVEEHLLICEPCRQAVAASDAYVAAMRMAAAKVHKADRKPRRKLAVK